MLPVASLQRRVIGAYKGAAEAFEAMAADQISCSIVRSSATGVIDQHTKNETLSLEQHAPRQGLSSSSTDSELLRPQQLEL